MRLACIAALLFTSLALGSESRSESIARGVDRFIAGGSVSAREPVKGDLVAAGGELRIGAPVAGDVLAAGGSLRLDADFGQDLYAAGGEVLFDGVLGRNARMAGGDLELGPRSRIEGSASLAGGRARVLGTVQGYLQAAAGRVLIDGRVGGDVEVMAGALELGPRARIEGSLRYRARAPLRADAAARVAGGIERLPFEAYDERGARAAARAAFAVFVAGLMLLAALFAWRFPQQSAGVALAARQRFGWSLLVGFIVLFAVPPAIVLSFVSLVGIPLAVLALLGYLALLLAGYVAGGLALGSAALRRWQGDRRRIVAAALGVLAVSVLALVPWLGAALAFVALLVGMGSLLLSMQRGGQASV